MEEFDKIKAFSESVTQREAHLAAQDDHQDQIENKSASDLDLPQYLSQFRSQLPEEKSESNLLFWALIGLGILLVLGIGGFFYFYTPETGEREIVVISPTPTPVKVRPENPGGLKIAGTDKVVYNRTSAHKAEIVEKSFPEPEQPILPPAEQMISEPEISEQAPIPQEVETLPIFEDSAEVEIPVVQPQEDQPAEQETQKVVVPVVPEKEKIEPIPAQKQLKQGWKAQLLSSSNKAKVEGAWKDISKKHKALLSDMPYQVVTVNIPGKGTFYRLQVGAFANKDMVMNLCEKLKKKKQDCIPVKAEK